MYVLYSNFVLVPFQTVSLQVVREYDGVGIQVLLANPTTPVCKALNRYGFFKRYSSERLFPTVASAVSYARDGHRVVGPCTLADSLFMTGL